MTQRLKEDLELRQSGLFTDFLNNQLPDILARVNEVTAQSLFDKEKADFLALIQDNMNLLDALLKQFARQSPTPAAFQSQFGSTSTAQLA